MIDIRTKKSATFTDLLALISWCEIYIGPKLAVDGAACTPLYYRHLRGRIAQNVGFPFPPKMTFQVPDRRTFKNIAKAFPKTIRKAG